MLILIAFAFLSGLVTVLSPCILPVLPIVLASSVGGRARPLGVVVGLIASFSLTTLLLSRAVLWLGLSASSLRLGAVLVLVLMGATMLLPAIGQRVEALASRLSSGASARPRAGWGSGLLLGASLGLLWAPCAGPILAAVIVLAATQQVTLGAAMIVLAYAVGAGVPLLLIAYSGQAVMGRLRGVTQRLRVQQLFGSVMLLMALLILLNAEQRVTLWATQALPADWSAQLTALEINPQVEQELARLRSESRAQPEPTLTLPPSTATPLPTLTPTRAATAAPTERVLLPTLTPEPTMTPLIALDDLGPAPELRGISTWLNSEPLTLDALRGKVVLVNFWTFGCINCQRTLPYITSWYEKYKDEGFVVIGVHTPEFAYEYETANVQEALLRHGITYPVAQDNEFQSWRAYENHYWPAEYFIDAQGTIRHLHIGEGKYDESEKIIQQLLAEAKAMATR